MNELSRPLRLLARDWPPALVRALASWLERGDSLPSIERGLPSAETRFQWRVVASLAQKQEMSGAGLALALLASLETVLDCEQALPELVWTGPNVGHSGIRRTDAALLEVIQSARRTLWIVTFAVHGGQVLGNALKEAAERGVTIHFLSEWKESGKIASDNWRSLRELLPPRTRLYEWPLEQRGRNELGSHGTLHAKVAVADEDLALLSSANLTDCALDFNLESGVLLRGESAKQIAKQLNLLMQREVIRPHTHLSGAD